MHVRVDVLNQAKVQQDHAALVSHQHIRRLYVAMQLAHFVKGVDAFGELPQSRAQTCFIQLIVRIDEGRLIVDGHHRAITRGRGIKNLSIRGRVVRRRRRSLRRGQSGISGSFWRSGTFRAHILNEGHSLNQLHREEPVLSIRSEFIQRH